MPGESQEQFMARVRDALADRGEPVDLPDDLEIARVIGADQDIVEVFLARVNETGMHAHRVADEAGLLEKIAELVGSLEVKTAVVPEEPIPARDQIVARLEERGVTLLNLDDPDASFEADLGITGAASAVAETASISVLSGDGHRRLASLAVPSHIAVVRTEQIMPDLLDWGAAAPVDMPANEVLISGPSKTADIEMTLVQGVHGPGKVHVIVLG